MMPVGIERTDTHWTLTLNRSEKRNAVCADLVEQLIATFERLAREDVPLVALRAALVCSASEPALGERIASYLLG
jgi:enoyl-CoA hydratase/carnithine racemase